MALPAPPAGVPGGQFGSGIVRRRQVCWTWKKVSVNLRPAGVPPSGPPPHNPRRSARWAIWIRYSEETTGLLDLEESVRKSETGGGTPLRTTPAQPPQECPVGTPAPRSCGYCPNGSLEISLVLRRASSASSLFWSTAWERAKSRNDRKAAGDTEPSARSQMWG